MRPHFYFMKKNKEAQINFHFEDITGDMYPDLQESDLVFQFIHDIDIEPVLILEFGKLPSLIEEFHKYYIRVKFPDIGFWEVAIKNIKTGQIWHKTYHVFVYDFDDLALLINTVERYMAF